MSATDVIERARSVLFVPGTRTDWVAKAFRAGADLVVVDLEDAVAAADKERARAAVAQLSARPALTVRCNPPGSAEGRADLAALRTAGWSGGVVIPKVESAADIAAVRRAWPEPPLLALVESAVGLVRAPEIATAEGVVRLAFGLVDYQRDLGLPGDPAGLDYPRSMLAVASRVAGLPAPVDGPVVALGDGEAVAADARRARALGMRGKVCIHPAQVPVVNAVFSPGAEEIEWARRVIAAADAAGQGVLRVDGEMVDRPVLDRARQILSSAGS